MPHSTTKPVRSSSKSWGQVTLCSPLLICIFVRFARHEAMALVEKLCPTMPLFQQAPSAKRVLRTAVLRVLHHRHTRPMHGPGTLYIGSRPPRVSCMQGCSGVSNEK